MTDLFEVSREKREMMMREVLDYLSHADYDKCNPEIMAGTWEIITRHLQNPNPYFEIKNHYNTEVLKMSNWIETLITNSEQPFYTALKIAIVGNLIDFSASHTFDLQLLESQIKQAEQMTLAVDDSHKLYDKLRNAQSLLYLGDNCGEICLDKLLMRVIRIEFPHLKLYYGVRGKTIINDVTIEDATNVGMDEVATVIDNGDGSLGTVMSRVSDTFKEIFYQSDVVIAKGQGNFESLSEIDRSHVFHLFMAKCEPVATVLGVKNLSILCIENTSKTR